MENDRMISEVYVTNQAMNFDQALKQAGLPKPIPTPEYEQTYYESLTRFLFTLIPSVVLPFVGLGPAVLLAVWGAFYAIACVLVHVKKLPKSPSVAFEFSAAIQYFMTFSVIYVLVYNGYILFNKSL